VWNQSEVQRLFKLPLCMEGGIPSRNTGWTMSQENVDIVRRFFKAVERLLEAWEPSRSLLEAMKAGDSPPEAREALGCMHPEAEWNPVFSGETYRGQLELGRAMDELLQAAENYSMKLLDIIDLENDRVLAVYGLNLEGKTSGIDVSATMFAVVRFQDGLIARMDEYADRRPALEAAGVRE
jgi:ketosteroid isomerase-like protein